VICSSVDCVIRLTIKICARCYGGVSRPLLRPYRTQRSFALFRACTYSHTLILFHRFRTLNTSVRMLHALSSKHTFYFFPLDLLSRPTTTNTIPHVSVLVSVPHATTTTKATTTTMVGLSVVCSFVCLCVCLLYIPRCSLRPVTLACGSLAQDSELRLRPFILHCIKCDTWFNMFSILLLFEISILYTLFV